MFDGLDFHSPSYAAVIRTDDQRLIDFFLEQPDLLESETAPRLTAEAVYRKLRLSAPYDLFFRADRTPDSRRYVVSSTLSQSKSFYMPVDYFKTANVYLTYANNPYASLITFYSAGADVITATSFFIPSDLTENGSDLALDFLMQNDYLAGNVSEAASLGPELLTAAEYSGDDLAALLAD